MVAVQRTAEVDWTGSIARGSGRASGGSGAFGDLPITVASRFGEPEGKTTPEELIAAAHAACSPWPWGQCWRRGEPLPSTFG
jgi:lipoyl-dependent peroxiredoxin